MSMTPCKRSVTLRGVRRSVDAGVVIVTDILLVMVMVMVMVVLVSVAMVMIALHDVDSISSSKVFTNCILEKQHIVTLNASKQKKIGGLPTVVETRRDCGGGPENPETGQPAPQLIGFDFVIAIGMSIMTHGSMEDKISVGN